MKISFVIPAYNEEAGIGLTLDSIPVKALEAAGYEVERVVVNNASTDRTADIARKHGARVVYEQKRGYGNAYQAGFSSASGDIIACGDADLTYPFDYVPELLDILLKNELDFINTDRLTNLRNGSMQTTHIFGNYLLSFVMRFLFDTPFKDSQSGMWVFKRSIWQNLNVEHIGMPFSQEIKIEAYTKGFKCAEVPIDYRRRVGSQKLSVVDAWRTMFELFKKRLTLKRERYDLTAEKVE
jgi:glycosyltransferase involved in cell wall biosynthesis